MKKGIKLMGTLLMASGILMASSCASTEKTKEKESSVDNLALPISITGEDVFESAQSASDNIVTGWNLGNTFDSTGQGFSGGDLAYETAWGNVKTTQELIIAVKEAGFNAVRLPVTWEFHTDRNGKVRSVWMKRVHEVVDYIISQDMYCILNVHHDRWASAYPESYSKYAQRFANLWTNIANEFIDYDEKLLFESTNEMLDKEQHWSGTIAENYKVLNKWSQVFVNSVRATGGKNYCRNLVTMTYAGSSDKPVLDAFVLPTDIVENHLLLEVHNYDPQGFCWIKASGQKMTNVWDEKEYGPGLIATLDRIQNYGKQINVPIVMGEWGSEQKRMPDRTMNDEERAKHAAFFVRECGKRGIKCFWWDCGDFALMDRKTPKQIHVPVIQAIVNTAKEF